MEETLNAEMMDVVDADFGSDSDAEVRSCC